jgi:hypothetical protein
MSGSEPQKRAYQKPCLRTYGSLRQITQSVGTNGMNDGSGVKGMNKTG